MMTPLGQYAKSTSTLGIGLSQPLTRKQKHKENEQKEQQKYNSDAAVLGRFTLQAGARHLLPTERVAGCLRRRRQGWEHPEVWYSEGLGASKLVGLQTCASVWICPVCAAKITERRKHELTAALVAAKEWGLIVVMVSYTLRHRAWDSLDSLLGEQAGAAVKEKSAEPAPKPFYCVPVARWGREKRKCPARPARQARGLLGARQRALGGRVAQELYRACGVLGSIRALEVTWGADNGWHPHIHELLLVVPGSDLVALESGLRRQWDAGLRLAGARDVDLHGMNFTAGCNIDIAEYMEKFGYGRGWNVEHELTKQPVKNGREGRFTPTELLRSFAVDGDADAGRLWQEYARTFKGQRQLFWSEGLRSFLLPGAAECTDQQVADEVDTTSDWRWLATLTLEQLKAINYNNLTGQLLVVARVGDSARLEAWLAALEVVPVQITYAERLTCAVGEVSAGRLAGIEAIRLGLTYGEYLQWQRGGMAAIAVPEERCRGSVVADQACPERRHTLR